MEKKAEEEKDKILRFTSFTFKDEKYQPKDKPFILREAQHNKKDGTFAFKILPNGNIDGYFIYYANRKEKQIKIGRYDKEKVNGKNMMSLKDIRKKFNELSKEYQGGIDIKEQAVIDAAAKEKERQEQAEIERKKQMQGSFQQLVNLYLDYAQSEFSDHYYRAIKQAFALNLKDFDTTIKASDITKADIISVLHGITARGSLIMANRARAYLSAMFKWGIEFDDTQAAIKHNVQFFIESNPVANVKKPLKKEAPTERVLDEEEVMALWAALGKSGMSVHRANVFKLMLATGCRLEALSGLRWSEIDWNERLIVIPKARSKNGLVWVIPINNIAYDVLANNPKLHDELLFPATNGAEPLRLDGYSKATARLCKQFDMEPFTPKDLRTTFKTLGGKAGLSKDIRDRIQNHALDDVSSKHYDRYDYIDEKWEAMNRWNTALTRIIDGTYTQLGLKPVAAVLQIKKTA